MKDKSSDHVPGDLMRYAAPHNLQKLGFMGLPGIAPDDPRYPNTYMESAGNVPGTAGDHIAGRCRFCGTMPDDPCQPPKFCTECGRPFQAYVPDQKEEKP